MSVYRLIVDTGLVGNSWRYATGANYPGCDRINDPDKCDPRSYATVDLAAADAYSFNEIPVLVQSVQDVDAILDGSMPVPIANVVPNPNPGGGNGGNGGSMFDSISPTMWLVIGAGALFFLSRRRA